ncbi:MAG TPA: hypothetical protein VHM90_13645, partial [Phycisphaerae bacterium]|nr:hypothetical protein [Phycisphaerae bacterium]
MTQSLFMSQLKRSGGGAGAVGGSLAGMLVRVLSEQKKIYGQILELARQQSGYVATGESEALMVVLGARARLIEQV